MLLGFNLLHSLFTELRGQSFRTVPSLVCVGDPCGVAPVLRGRLEKLLRRRLRSVGGLIARYARVIANDCLSAWRCSRFISIVN